MKRDRLFPWILWLLFLVPAVSHAFFKSGPCQPEDCLGGIEEGRAGFLLVAPDRGYAGNQRVRTAFETFDKKYNAELVFITDERMRPFLHYPVPAGATLSAGMDACVHR